jgi:hypothetical protein
MTVTMADQLAALDRQVEALAGRNAHLVEDTVLGEVVEFAANGRHTNAFDEVVGGAFEPRVRVVTADPEGMARYPHEPGLRHADQCDRCGLRFGPAKQGKQATRMPDGSLAELVSDGWDGRDGTRHIVWIPAGSAVVEVVACRTCRTYLDGSFASVEWRE